MNATYSERQNLTNALANAYTNSVGQLILNFGKTFVPVAKDWAQLAETTAVEPGCDYECALNLCISPYEAGNPDFECMSTYCDCNFLITSLPQREVQRRMSNYQHSTEHLENFLNEQGQEFVQSIQPAVQDYMIAEQQVYQDFADLVQTHAVNDFGCDATCVTDCTNQQFMNFREIPVCVAQCPCNQQVLNITGGSYNYPSLMAYSQYNLQAWSFFKLNQ